MLRRKRRVGENPRSGSTNPPQAGLNGYKAGSRLHGEMTEWLKVHAWKACVPLKGYRGFESLSLRQFGNWLAFQVGKT